MQPLFQRLKGLTLVEKFYCFKVVTMANIISTYFKPQKRAYLEKKWNFGLILCMMMSRFSFRAIFEAMQKLIILSKFSLYRKRSLLDFFFFGWLCVQLKINPLPEVWIKYPIGWVGRSHKNKVVEKMDFLSGEDRFNLEPSMVNPKTWENFVLVSAIVVRQEIFSGFFCSNFVITLFQDGPKHIRTFCLTLLFFKQNFFFKY